jgi:hypothetical protein
MEKIDPRRVGAIHLQLDALKAEAKARGRDDLANALKPAFEALQKYQDMLEAEALYLQLPDDYKPPKGIGCGGSKPKR